MLLHFQEASTLSWRHRKKTEIFVPLKKHTVRLKGHIGHPYCNLERELF